MAVGRPGAIDPHLEEAGTTWRAAGKRLSCLARNESVSAQGKKVADRRCRDKSEAARSDDVLRSDMPNRGRDERDLEDPSRDDLAGSGLSLHPGSGFARSNLHRRPSLMCGRLNRRPWDHPDSSGASERSQGLTATGRSAALPLASDGRTSATPIDAASHVGRRIDVPC